MSEYSLSLQFIIRKKDQSKDLLARLIDYNKESYLILGHIFDLVNKMFICLEGSEAVGKTVQIKLLEQTFALYKYSTSVAREPGGTKVAEQIRNIILSNEPPV